MMSTEFVRMIPSVIRPTLRRFASYSLVEA